MKVKLKLKRKKKESDRTKLIGSIYDSVGGLTAAAKLMGVTKQLASFWKQQGHITLTMVPEMAKKLRVDPQVLNPDVRGFLEMLK